MFEYNPINARPYLVTHDIMPSEASILACKGFVDASGELGEVDARLRRQDQVGAPGQSQVGLSAAQTANGQVGAHQR